MNQLVEPACPPALHIWIDAKKRHIERTLNDWGNPKSYKHMEKYLKDQGFSGLYRIVVTDGEIRVIPPGEEETG